MSWQDRIASDKWRLVARKGGKIVHEITTRDERAARYAFAGLFAANSKANEDGKGWPASLFNSGLGSNKSM